MAPLVSAFAYVVQAEGIGSSVLGGVHALANELCTLINRAACNAAGCLQRVAQIWQSPLRVGGVRE